MPNIQISFVGYEDRDAVFDAVADQALFIHVSGVDDGRVASIAMTAAAKESKKNDELLAAAGVNMTKTQRRKYRLRRLDRKEVELSMASSTCRSACGSEEARTDLPDGTSTVCDSTCLGDDARFDGFLCGARNAELFGDMCRLCYVCPHEARKAERAIRSYVSNGGAGEKHAVIMCDTMTRPVPEGTVANAAGCSDECADRKDTVSPQKAGLAAYINMFRFGARESQMQGFILKNKNTRTPNNLSCKLRKQLRQAGRNEPVNFFFCIFAFYFILCHVRV